MESFLKSDRNRVRRIPDRGTYRKSEIYAILDEGLYCQVGFVVGGMPYLIPTLYARMGEKVILHGSRASRLMKHIRQGNEICIAVTLLDGLVLARSAFHHSMNYRSVILFGKGREIGDEVQKLEGLKLLSEHMLPGRWEDVRKPNKVELAQTSVVAVEVEEAAAKIRTGPPGDEESDYDLPIWAGILPAKMEWLTPLPDPRLNKDVPIPAYLLAK